MDKRYKHQTVEQDIYQKWESSGYFSPEVNPKGDPYSVILPPPNANAPLHFGHAMYVTEDVLVRFKRMCGYKTLWLPGADHAGFETQYVFEKHLRERGKSRLDYTQEELFHLIWDFVQKNRGGMENQLRMLGFSLDWSRLTFTMDEDVVKIVHKTFKRLYDEGLVYRDKRLINYCTVDGTSFSDLEVNYREETSPLYYIQYGPFVLATTRPETKFGDTAIAVHPEDSRYSEYIGKDIEIQDVLGKSTITVVADEAVDPEFGTGAVKVTPAHDFVDYEIGVRHDLPMKQVIGFDGRMNEHAGTYAGLTIKEARERVVNDLKAKNLLVKVDTQYTNRVGTCYKCGAVIEPLPMDQWFVKTKPLAKLALKAVKEGEITIYPEHFKKNYNHFLSNIRDWNISRQIAWGIRIPAWKNEKTGEWVVTDGEHVPGNDWVQDTDTFDTWFSSGQWPFVTLQVNKEGDYETFYPTSVMETGYDILPWWVARMVMLGIYATRKVPFHHVVLHGLVNDPEGKKMSKSKGNVVNPIDVVEEYGADAVRFALLYGTALGHDQALSFDKLRSMRNFVNKIWNMGRFISIIGEREGLCLSEQDLSEISKKGLHEKDKKIISETEELGALVTSYLDVYDFNHATQELYDFAWHRFADVYIEDVKERVDSSSFLVLGSVYFTLLKLLHPFIPFVTEEIYRNLYKGRDMLIISKWPSKL